MTSKIGNCYSRVKYGRLKNSHDLSLVMTLYIPHRDIVLVDMYRYEKGKKEKEKKNDIYTKSTLFYAGKKLDSLKHSLCWSPN